MCAPSLRSVTCVDANPSLNHRLDLEGLFWTAPAGLPWRDITEAFGKWSSVCRQFRRWTLAGLRGQILEARNETG